MAEEYILDTCFFFEADRVECAKRLAGGACGCAFFWGCVQAPLGDGGLESCLLCFHCR